MHDNTYAAMAGLPDRGLYPAPGKSRAIGMGRMRDAHSPRALLCCAEVAYIEAIFPPSVSKGHLVSVPDPVRDRKSLFASLNLKLTLTSSNIHTQVPA